MKKVLVLITILFLLLPFTVLAQDFCKGDFDYNGSVDAEDITTFLEHFGRNLYNNPCPSDGPAPVPKTGQTACYTVSGIQTYCADSGQDGEYQKGVTWPNPRFTDNGDGTVTDNLTGLIWLKDANCFGTRTWSQALSDCNGLADGQCGLTDGSNAGDWRLPNKRELISLTHDGYYDPSIPNTAGTGKWSEGDPFNTVQSDGYWSSTSDAYNGVDAWFVILGYGQVGFNVKTFSLYVWPVRGGQ